MNILEKVKKNKKTAIIILIVAIVIFIMFFSIRTIIVNNLQNKKAEELATFSWEQKSFILNEDYTYTFQVLVTVQEIEGIETISYLKNGEEIVLNCNGRQKVGIDYEAVEDEEYEFKITPIGGTQKTEILQVKRKVSGEDTYKLINGVYVNTPFTENFNKKYTRYLSVTEQDSLTPGNWILDEEPENWYDYKNQKWANIYVETEGAEIYYVWIPRYVYKLDNEAQRTDVKFVDVYNNYINANTGEKLTFKQLLEQGYELPEAFDFGDEELTYTSISGYWISKYQLSELETFNLNYNMLASKESIIVSNFTNNVSDKSTEYTYAINGKIVNRTNTLQDYSFTNLETSESYIINVTALDEKGSILGSMTKVLEPTETNPPDLKGFDSDTTFYVYWDENGIEHNEIPISQNPPADWYNYTYAQWANIVTRNEGLETYYVWIPRYQYKLNNLTERTDVKFIMGTGTETQTGYEIPEAFWFDVNDDGIEDQNEQLTGYWITKYQLSIEESEARVTAELTASGDCIHVKDIIGTLITEDTSFKFEYYLNGELKHEGTSNTENYTYQGLNLDTTYTINIIVRNADTNAYVGAITKKVTTKFANAPDLTSFRENEGLKLRTYYVVYNGDEISNYIPISEGEPVNWYDYSKSKWANIVVTDGNVTGNTISDATATTYYVWIPRYQYRILQEINDWSNLSTANARTDVKFVEGKDTNTEPGYQIPEAFWFDVNDDNIEDENEQLTGYWITKYQLNE